jgi:hypothetical protein
MNKIKRALVAGVAGLALVGAAAGPASAVRIGSGAPGHVAVVNHARFTIKVSGHKVKYGHTRFNVDSDTITVRANHKWKIGALGNGGAWTPCQSANVTHRIGVTKNNSGKAHQFVVAAC